VAELDKWKERKGMAPLPLVVGKVKFGSTVLDDFILGLAGVCNTIQ